MPTNEYLIQLLVLLSSRLTVLRLIRLARLLVSGVVSSGRVRPRYVAIRLGPSMIRTVALQLFLWPVMRSHLVLPSLLTASILEAATMFQVLDRAFALNLRAILVRTLLVLVLVW